MIAEIEQQTGRTVPLTVVPTEPGDPGRTAADHSRATALLGWRPRIDLRHGIADQIAHHRSYHAVAETVA